MSGQRRGQFVSIAMGPGIYSNTTGRGAHTRLNYQNFDRWKDGSWVRWHKLLPEKQGGWAYVPLTSNTLPVTLIPGSAVLYLHFDQPNGAQYTVDSGVLNNAVAFNTALSVANASISDATPKFGVGAFAYTLISFTYGILVPGIGGFAKGSFLDICAVPNWTIALWFKITAASTATTPCHLFSYNDDGVEGAASQNCFSLDCIVNGDGLTATYRVYAAGVFGNEPSGQNVIVVTNAPCVVGTWYYFALVNNSGGSGLTLYQNGVAIGNLISGGGGSFDPGNYTYVAGSAVNIGAYSRSTSNVPAQIDDFMVVQTNLYNQTFTPPTASNTFGTPNTLGEVNQPSGILPNTYLGVCRDLHDWASIDGQYWIAIGTHLKLYVVNQATLYDITPDRNTSNVSNALTTVNGSDVVTVVDNGHQANTGDFIDIVGAVAVGGLTLAGTYQISVIDPNTYTIVTAADATSSATGGGNFSIAYEMYTGLAANGELLGYGTSTYGNLTYGTPRAQGTGVMARMRTWSLDNYGEDLVASQSDGEIYYWTKASGPNSPAMILTNAPTGCQRVIVDAQQRVIIALGCTDVTSQYDSMLVRWCSFDDVTDWVPTDTNTAGDDLLTAGSRIITGIKTKGQNLIFTDTTLYRMVFVGGTDIYDFYPAGQVTIVGPNAAVDVDGVAYLMGFDNFYNYSGTLNLQSCDVWETVFDPNVSTSLNRSQSEGVVCFTYEPKTEITWLYPSIGGTIALTLASAPAQGATSATLATAWTGSTGYYTVQFSDQEAQAVLLTNGSTAIAWTLPLTAAVTVAATLIGNDRYVTYNWEDGTWYYGAWTRTCANGRAPALNGYPYGANAGYLYQHEVGTDAVESYGTQAIGFYMQSLDITIGGAKSEYTMGGSDARFTVGGSDAHLLVRSLLPDWAYFTGTMNVTLLTKDRPQDTPYVVDGPVAFTNATDQIDIDAHGSQLVMQFDNYTGTNGAPSLGCSFRMGIVQGLAIPYAKR